MTPAPERAGGGGPDVPIYQKVANHVRLLISSGLVAAGKQLPSENELADKFETTRNTVREGMRILIHEGHVESIKTKGYFVRDLHEIIWPMTTRDSVAVSDGSAVDPWLTVVMQEGWTGRQEIRVEVVNASTHLVRGVPLDQMLDVGPSGRAVGRMRVRYIRREGEEYERAQEIANSYFPYDLVLNTEIMGGEDIQPSVFPILDQLGHRRAGFRDVLGPRMPTQSEIQKLNLPPGTPVLETVRRSRFTPDDRILLVRHSVYSNGNLLSYEVGA